MKTGLQATYINPLTDFGFKKLFGDENNRELLADFLSEIIAEEGHITEINYLPPEKLGRTEDDRKAVFDIYCKNERGEYFIVEMQKARQLHFVDRSLFYATFPIQEQAPQGIWHFDLKAVYLVGILDFDYFDGDDYIERIYLAREKTHERFSSKLTFTYVILPKFRKTLAELASNADRWLFCLKRMAELDSRPAEVQGRVFERLFKAAEINKLKEKDMREYNKSILEYADVRDCADCAHQLGMQQGMWQGRQEGRQEVIFSVAKKLNESGASVELIATVTGLSAEEISRLPRD